jgi:hypothetical protein
MTEVQLNNSIGANAHNKHKQAKYLGAENWNILF